MYNFVIFLFFFVLQVFNEIAFCYFSVFFINIASVNDIAFCYFSHSGHCTGQ